MHVPYEDVHARSGFAANTSTASVIAWVVTGRRQICAGSVQTRERHIAHGTVWSPSTIVRVPHGAHRVGGTTGAKIDTTGTRTAAARCAGPVLPTISADSHCR